MKIMIVSILLSTLTIPFVGKVCDNMAETKIMPISFLTRFLSTVAFCFLKTPNDLFAYVVAVIMIVGTIVENISVESIFLKNLPKETRGILCGAMSFVGQLGILFYTLVAGYMFDNIGPGSPFVLLGSLDLIFVILCFISYKKGIIKF